MALNIRDPEVDELATQLARQKGVTKTQAVKEALRRELERVDRSTPLLEKLRPLIDEISKWPDTGIVTDKAFYDDLSGEDER